MHPLNLLNAAAACGFLSLSGCAKKDAPSASAAPASSTATISLPPAPPAALVLSDEKKLYLDAARTAWSFVQKNYQPATGLTRAHETYANITLWDIGGVIAAHYAAHRLGLINDALYDKRIQRVLKTLATVPLVDNTAFNSTYSSVDGTMVTRAGKPTATGDGWSVTDIGRLLIWLKVLAAENPKYAGQSEAIVKRLDMAKLVQGGYPLGMSLDETTGEKKYFPETEIGYQQYASSGFAMWGAAVAPALDMRANSVAVSVLGVPLLADTRKNDRVMSEGFLMSGLETGWFAPAMRDQAVHILAAQEARYKSTQIVTMVTEDAMPDKPYYFYYYSIYHRGRPFVVEGPAENAEVESPRWVSSKAAFAWNALLPSDYTRLAVKTVQPAATPGRGWGSGVYEGTNKPVGVRSLNTAALILESALFAIQGKPITTWSPKG